MTVGDDYAKVEQISLGYLGALETGYKHSMLLLSLLI